MANSFIPAPRGERQQNSFIPAPRGERQQNKRSSSLDTVAGANKGLKILSQALFLILTMGLLWVIFNQFVFTSMPTSWTDSISDSPVFGGALMYGFNSLLMPAILVGIGLIAVIAMTGRGG